MQQFEERQKHNLPQFGKTYDLKVPKSKAIYTADDLYKLPEDMEYPVVIKGKFYDAYIVYNIEQARTSYNRISAKWGLPVIIQEFVHGTEYNITGLGDGKGLPIKKCWSSHESLSAAPNGAVALNWNS